MRATTRCPQKSSRAVPPAFTLLASQIIVPLQIRRRRYLLQVQRQAVLLEFDSLQDLTRGYQCWIDYHRRLGDCTVRMASRIFRFCRGAGGQIGELGFKLRRSLPGRLPRSYYSTQFTPDLPFPGNSLRFPVHFLSWRIAVFILPDYEASTFLICRLLLSFFIKCNAVLHGIGIDRF